MLSGGDATAYSYISWVRVKVMERYEEAFNQLEVIGAEAFIKNSHFYRKELRLPVGSEDDSEGMEVSEEADTGADEVHDGGWGWEARKRGRQRN